MAHSPVIMWFRRDLRLADNDALRAAVATGAPVMPVFVLDQDAPRPFGGAHLWWLDASLRRLGEALSGAGSPLVLRQGQTVPTLLAVLREAGADRIVAGRLYGPGERAMEAELSKACEEAGFAFETFRGSLLTEPGAIRTGGGTDYRVFTPYMRALRDRLGEVEVAPAVHKLPEPPKAVKSDDLNAWKLHPTAPDWSKRFDWTPGEAAAQARLTAFVAKGLQDYPKARELPGEDGSSRLSPHLHWGELSSRQVWKAAAAAGEVHHKEEVTAKFLAEIGWRDFSHQVLWHHPTLSSETFNPGLAKLKWRNSDGEFDIWRRGRTGYPIVDAGMRQLWATGWMHNRVRMIVASFLSKDLLIDWREGEGWFWDCLVDGDEANNSMNWQWVSGTGPDAQPFFRIFNPVGQSEKFDRAGGYIREWVPELAKLSDRDIHAPWTLPPGVLADADITLGETYPKPMVDHAEARDRALEAMRAARD